MINKIVYISGKITGCPDLNKPKFSHAEKELKKIYKKVINPHKLPANHDKSWEAYMKACIIALCKCDVVFLLDDWMQSKGAMLEFEIAAELGLEIKSVENQYFIK